jgi:hypothetical protein
MFGHGSDKLGRAFRAEHGMRYPRRSGGTWARWLGQALRVVSQRLGTASHQLIRNHTNGPDR